MQRNVNATVFMTLFIKLKNNTVGVFSKIMVNKNIHANKKFKCRDLGTCPAPYSSPYLLSGVT